MLGSGTGTEQWRPFELKVVRRELGRIRGLLRETNSGPVVAVNAKDHARTQRFTVAHELAHLLMANVDRAAIGLTGSHEERICEEFASHLLIPRNDLERRLTGFEDDPAELLELSVHYDVSISAFLGAAGEQLAARDVVAFAASKRGHRKRPAEVAFRAFPIRCGAYLMPDEVRLTSLGLTCLDHRLEAHGPGVEISDSDIRVNLRLWSPGVGSRSGTASGPVSWRARLLRNGIAVICLNTPALTQRWSSARLAA